MARTISQIQQALLDQVNADATLSSLLTSTSNVAIWRLWTYIVAFCQWTIETLFDQHINEVNNIIITQKPHTLQWYVYMAKQFQYGDALIPDTDTYAVIDTTKQLVSYAAATEIFKGIRIKVAKTTSGDLAPLSSSELTAFTSYASLIKDAGVRLYITSTNADRLILNLKIYYNALVLDSTGQRLDGTGNTPVQDTISLFLENLPFNGLYINYRLLNALAAVDGVIIPEIVSASANYGILTPSIIESEYQPDAGYLRIADPDDLTITFIPHVPI